MNRTPEEYIRRFRLASTMAGNRDEEWNLKYLTALRLLGLTLGSEKDKYPDMYPNGWPVGAINPPLINSDDKLNDGWWTDVIWININPTKHVVVCAAVRGENGFIVTGIRHYSMEMREQISKRVDGDMFKNRPHEEQGFICNYGIYMSREEAFLIAKIAGQLDKVKEDCRHLYLGNELYSEMLY